MMPSSMGHHEHTGLMSATLSRGLTENLEMGSGILDREGPRVPTGPSPGLAGAPGVGVPLSCQRDLCHSLPGSLGGQGPTLGQRTPEEVQRFPWVSTKYLPPPGPD